MTDEQRVINKALDALRELQLMIETDIKRYRQIDDMMAELEDMKGEA
jgi:hypothetical protein